MWTQSKGRIDSKLKIRVTTQLGGVQYREDEECMSAEHWQPAKRLLGQCPHAGLAGMLRHG